MTHVSEAQAGTWTAAAGLGRPDQGPGKPKPCPGRPNSGPGRPIAEVRVRGSEIGVRQYSHMTHAETFAHGRDYF